MHQKIPATVITGFLGAGKTTLIRHLLQNANGKRIALIINEFGDLGVDGEVVKGCGIENCREDDVMELSNGCICCTVAEDFIPTIQTLIDRDEAPDHIVIETSGLALPQPLVRAFNWPEIRTRVTVDGVVTVVDGAALSEGRFAHDETAVDAQRDADENLDHETPLSELFEDQLACADMVILNKVDLIDTGTADTVLGELQSGTRDGVRFVRSRMGEVPVDALLGLEIGAQDDLEVRREVHHHHDDDHDEDEHSHGHDEFESFDLELGPVQDVDDFTQTISAAMRKHDILRLKGFAAVNGKPMRLVVQAVGPRVDSYFDRPLQLQENGRTRLVVIGEAGMDMAAIRADLAG